MGEDNIACQMNNEGVISRMYQEGVLLLYFLPGFPEQDIAWAVSALRRSCDSYFGRQTYVHWYISILGGMFKI